MHSSACFVHHPNQEEEEEQEEETSASFPPNELSFVVANKQGEREAYRNETSLVGSGYGGQAVSSPLLECQYDAHWEELDWKINDSRSQKDLSVRELALHSVAHTVQRAHNLREPGEIFFSLERKNGSADRRFLKRLEHRRCVTSQPILKPSVSGAVLSQPLAAHLGAEGTFGHQGLTQKVLMYRQY